MRCNYTINPVLRLGVIQMSGLVTGVDVARCLRDLYTDPNWQSGFDTLWDGRGVEELHFLPEDLAAVRDLSAELILRQGSGRIAVVVHRSMDFEIAQLVLITRRVPNRAARVFWDLGEALSWLGLREAPSDLFGRS